MFHWKNIDCSIKLRPTVSWDGNFSCCIDGEIDLDGFIWSLNSFWGKGTKLGASSFFAPSSLTRRLVSSSYPLSSQWAAGTAWCPSPGSVHDAERCCTVGADLSVTRVTSLAVQLVVPEAVLEQVLAHLEHSHPLPTSLVSWGTISPPP